MALTGTYSRTLDDKRRLAVPKRLREDFGGKEQTCLYVAPGTDRSLSLYTSAAFEHLAQQLTERSSSRATIRNYFRLFYSRAEKVDLDGQGRVRIPDRLAEFAQLRRDVVLLGIQDHVEIWDRELWEAFLTQHSSEFDEMAEQALE